MKESLEMKTGQKDPSVTCILTKTTHLDPQLLGGWPFPPFPPRGPPGAPA